MINWDWVIFRGENMKNRSAINNRKNPYKNAVLQYVSKDPSDRDLTYFDSSSFQFLVNMVQGMFIRYLVNQTSNKHGITDEKLLNKLTLNVTQILQDSFLSIFREKMNQNKSLLYELVSIIKKTDESKNNEELWDNFYQKILDSFTTFKSIQVILNIIKNDQKLLSAREN